MKKTITKILLSLMIIGTLSQSANAMQISVLQSLINDATKNNPLIKAAEERVKRADSAVAEAKGKMGPKVGIMAGATWGKERVSALLPAPLSTVLPIGFKNTYITAIGFIQTIYAGGSLHANKQASEFARDAVFAEKTRIEQSVENSVRTAYYNRRRAVEKEKVAKQALSLTKEHLARAEKLHKAGVIAKGDILRTKVAIAEAEMNLIKAHNAVELSTTGLERAVGRNIDTQLLANDTYMPIDPLFGVTPPNIVESAYNSREELKMYKLLNLQAEKIAKAIKGQSLPQIFAGGALYSLDADIDFIEKDEEWRVGLLAYWTLFDSGQIKARTAQAKAQAKELLYRLEDMKNIVKMEVTQANQNLKSAKSRYIVALRRVAEAEEDYRIAVKRYEANVGTNLDMLDARLSLTNSKTDYIDSMFDIETALSELIYATGE